MWNFPWFSSSYLNTWILIYSQTQKFQFMSFTIWCCNKQWWQLHTGMFRLSHRFLSHITSSEFTSTMEMNWKQLNMTHWITRVRAKRDSNAKTSDDKNFNLQHALDNKSSKGIYPENLAMKISSIWTHSLIHLLGWMLFIFFPRSDDEIISSFD